MPAARLIKSGDRIRHPAYGVGVVLKVWRSGFEVVANVKWLEDHLRAFSVVIYEGVVVLAERCECCGRKTCIGNCGECG